MPASASALPYSLCIPNLNAMERQQMGVMCKQNAFIFNANLKALHLPILLKQIHSNINLHKIWSHEINSHEH